MTNTNYNSEMGYSPDALAQRKAELLTLLCKTAPEIFSDNQQININKLKELLGEGHTLGEEHFELNWAGKAAARREIQKTSSHTIMPDEINPSNAQHMLIKGENLEVLRVLQKSYYGKVKMIYIDPPYNTGNDSFVYPDDYSETLEEYLKRTGEKNEEGHLNKQSLWKKNTKESGQYHSAWLSMMYPRLYLARNLLRDDGVIFISIDDNEAANLKLLCDEIFGSENFQAQIVPISNPGGRDYKQIAVTHEYLFVYTKSDAAELNEIPKEVSFSKFDSKGGYELRELRNRNPKFHSGNRPNLFYPFYVNPHSIGPDGCCTVSLVRSNSYSIEVKPYNSEGKESVWRWGVQKSQENIIDDSLDLSQVVARQKTDGGWNIYEKNRRVTTKAKSVWSETSMRTEDGTRELRGLLGASYFDHPKSPTLVKQCVTLGSSDGDLILDFFAGSGTTAQAVIELNIEDGGNRQSISVQMPELLDEDSDAYRAGYHSIADITRARIDKVIAKLKAECPEKTIDLACANFTLAPSNFKVWRSDVTDASALRDQLALFQTAEKASGALQALDSQTAMLTELLLKHGLGVLGVHAISEPKQIAGVTIHRVLMQDERHLWLCFEPYTEALKDEIVKSRPSQVILLNSCFVGEKADELLSNLQLELSGLNIGLTVI